MLVLFELRCEKYIFSISLRLGESKWYKQLFLKKIGDCKNKGFCI